MSNKNTFHLLKKASAIIFIAVLIVATLSGVSKVYALNPLTSMWAIETNMDGSGAGQLWVAFKTSASGGVPGTITLAFTSATVATTNGNLVPTSTTCGGATGTFNFLNSGAGATALPGTLNATGASSTISLTGATSLAASTLYCVAFTGASAITNTSTAGVYSYTIADTQDTGTQYYPVLTAGTNEAITVSASVAQAFTLTLSGTSDNLGALSTSSVISTSGINATVSSNAASGVGLFAYDASSGLHSPGTTHTIASTGPNATTASTITTVAEGYVTNAVYQSTTSGAALTVATPFSGTGGTGEGLSTIPSEIAFNAAPTNASVIKIKENATITALTPEATDYADTVYVVGAGTF